MELFIGYQRLEPSPISHKFERNLNVELRDAYWTLFRQWQVGEFIGEDGGRAGKVQIAAYLQSIDKITNLRYDNYKELKLDGTRPLEAVVEQEALYPSLYLRLKLGNYFHSLLKIAFGEKINEAIEKYKSKYALRWLEDDNSILEEIQEDPDAFALYQSVKEKALDGYKLYQDIIHNNDSYNGWITNQSDQSLQNKYIEISNTFLNLVNRRWFGDTNFKDINFWHTDQIEYKFKIKNDITTLSAENYHNGQLDWFNFNVESFQKEKGELTKHAFIPTPIDGKGAPAQRYWEIEDGSINLNKLQVQNFGILDTKLNLKVHNTGILDLLLMEYHSKYSNDWFLIPYPMSVNSLCTLEGVLMTDVFGEHYYIKPANNVQSSLNNWNLFSLKFSGEQPQNLDHKTLFLAPTLLKSDESKPLEQIFLMRDEASNLVWAMEETVPSQLGYGISGFENSQLNNSVATNSNESNQNAGVLKYRLASSIPFNWIPFVPVPRKGSIAEMMLQRGQMVDNQAGRVNNKAARGVLLNENTTPLKKEDNSFYAGYFLREEEVAREGIQVTRSFQRARWINGEVVLWIGRQKKVGRGEGNSGLIFDQLH